MTYRDAVPRVWIAKVRGQFTPRAFRAMASVRLELVGVVGEVAIVHEPGTGVVGRARPWFACPRCGRRANVVGALAGVGWVCATCGGWRSRNVERPLGRNHDERTARVGRVATEGSTAPEREVRRRALVGPR